MTEEMTPASDTLEPVETSVETVTETPAEPEAGKTIEDTPFPKKAVNAISRRDKQIGKYRAELAQARAELEKYRQTPQNAPKPSDEPQEAQFDNYGEYLKAVAKHEARKEFQGESQKQQETARSIQEQQWVAQREAVITEQANALLESNPEYQQLVTENADILDEMPPHIERAFLEAENAAIAFVVLAKEGKLESLLTMSPVKAAMEIAKAEARGDSFTKPKVTKAPAPIAPARGASSSTKSLSQMSASELTKWAKS